MSHFSMVVLTNTTVKLANGNKGHAHGVGIILCPFTNCSIIYQDNKVAFTQVDEDGVLAIYSELMSQHESHS